MTSGTCDLPSSPAERGCWDSVQSRRAHLVTVEPGHVGTPSLGDGPYCSHWGQAAGMPGLLKMVTAGPLKRLPRLVAHAELWDVPTNPGSQLGNLPSFVRMQWVTCYEE